METKKEQTDLNNENEALIQSCVMQSALLSKIKIALRNKVGKYYKYFDFYFKDGCFCFKEKTQSEFMEYMMVKGAFDNKDDFEECVDQIYYRLINHVEKLKIIDNLLVKDKRQKSMQQRNIRNKVLRNLR